MSKAIDAPLIEDAEKRKRFVRILWGVYLGFVIVGLLLQKDVTKLMEDEQTLVSLIWLLYATYYFACRAKGDNQLFVPGGKPSTRGQILMSDATAAIMYVFFSGILVYKVLTA